MKKLKLYKFYAFTIMDIRFSHFSLEKKSDIYGEYGLNLNFIFNSCFNALHIVNVFKIKCSSYAVS